MRTKRAQKEEMMFQAFIIFNAVALLAAIVTAVAIVVSAFRGGKAK